VSTLRAPDDLTGHIELRSGSFLNFHDPDPTHITLDDVAHGLSHICRYTGQCTIFYSVAEHAVIVSRRLEYLGFDRDVQWSGLHHDDAEAFVGDVNRPLKGMLPEYKAIERRVWLAVNEALGLGLTDPQPRAVKDADNWALSAEAYHLLPSGGASWFSAGLYDPDNDPFPLGGLTPGQAKVSWLERHHELEEADGR
jgi:hypothetical protein